MNNPPRLFTKSYILLCLAHLLHALAYWVFIYLPVYLEDLGASKPMIGWIMGTAMISSLISRPIIGTRLDISGRRAVLAFGGSLQALACFLYLTIDQLGPWVYVVRALHGIGIGTIFSSFLAIASDIVPVERRTEGLAIWGMWGLLPMAIGPKMTETLIEGWGFSAAF